MTKHPPPVFCRKCQDYKVRLRAIEVENEMLVSDIARLQEQIARMQRG